MANNSIERVVLNDSILATVDKARLLLASAKDASSAKNVVDMAYAAAIFAKRQKLSYETIGYARAVMLDARRLLGGFLKAMPKNKGAKGSKVTGVKKTPVKDDTPTIASLGIDKNEAKEIRRLARMTEAAFDKLRESDPRFSTGAHVSKNSGVAEWYTPTVYLDAVRKVLGEIDLDPASCDVAQKLVKAKRHFTCADDGLYKNWTGKVFMNPPYGEKCGEFTDKLCDSVESGDVSEAILLINNATETKWFQRSGRLASAICFPSSRIKFLDDTGEPACTPLQGQAFIYFGARPKDFIATFDSIGFCVMSK